MAPETVTFVNGEAKRVGVGSLYLSGTNAWMISAGLDGTISFAVPAKQVTLFQKDQDNTVVSTLAFLDINGTEITPTTTVASMDFTQYKIYQDDQSAGVSMITITNINGLGYSVIEDFFSSSNVESSRGGTGGDTKSGGGGSMGFIFLLMLMRLFVIACHNRKLNRFV